MELEGLLTPIVTPFTKEGDICSESLQKIIGRVAPHCTAIMPGMTTGHGWTLSLKQWDSIVDLTIQHSQRLPVIPGLLRKTEKDLFQLIICANKKPVSALAIAVPSSGFNDQSQMIDLFAKINARTSLPIILYLFGDRLPNQLEITTILEICRTGCIAGIKDSYSSVVFTNKLIASLKEEQLAISVWQGFENLYTKTYGCSGGIFPLANLYPSECKALIEKLTAQEQGRINKLLKLHGLESQNWLFNLKEALYQLNLINPIQYEIA